MTRIYDNIAKLQKQLDSIEEIRQKSRNSIGVNQWIQDTKSLIRDIFGPNTLYEQEFDSISYDKTVWKHRAPQAEIDRVFLRGLDQAKILLNNLIEKAKQDTEIHRGEGLPLSFEIILRVEHICSRFHLIAQQLTHRYNNRTALKIEDEYDVQYLLHALLTLDFEDIREEEWTPSYAGGASRIDFLLKKEQIVIEAKKTRKGLGAKEVGGQLIIDITRYQVHPECKYLICFVYDPEARIKNPRGIENDLSRQHNDLQVKVLIMPKGL